MSTAPGAPKSQVNPGANRPPNASPKTQTTRPHARPESPANRDHRPRGATISSTPIPIWIHTVAAAASTGCLSQIVIPTLTIDWTHPRDAEDAGFMTAVGTPGGI